MQSTFIILCCLWRKLSLLFCKTICNDHCHGSQMLYSLSLYGIIDWNFKSIFIRNGGGGQMGKCEDTMWGFIARIHVLTMGEGGQIFAHLKACLNDPTFHPTFTQNWCWVKCWIAWTSCWVTQHWLFRCWVKFDSSEKCWVTVANNSIVLKCWMKFWVVWPPQPTLLALCMRSPLKQSRAICILIVVPSLKRTAPSQRIQIIASIEMLDEMLGDLNASPNICKICWLKCWLKCWIV